MSECVECGKLLTYRCHTEYEFTGEFGPPSDDCIECDAGAWVRLPKDIEEPAARGHTHECAGCGGTARGREKRRIVSRRRLHDLPGPYGDGFFCSLTCGWRHAIRILEKRV